MAIDIPNWTRPILALWYCRIRGVHDFAVFGVGKPYAFRVCSLCRLKVEGENTSTQPDEGGEDHGD